MNTHKQQQHKDKQTVTVGCVCSYLYLNRSIRPRLTFSLPEGLTDGERTTQSVSSTKKDLKTKTLTHVHRLSHISHSTISSIIHPHSGEGKPQHGEKKGPIMLTFDHKQQLLQWGDTLNNYIKASRHRPIFLLCRCTLNTFPYLYTSTSKSIQKQ